MSSCFTCLLGLAAALPARAAGTSYTLTTDGAWTWFNDPRAIYLSNNIYTGWVDSGGFIKFAGHDLSTHATTTATLYNGNFFQRDDHDNPAFLVNSPTSLTAFYAPHAGGPVRMQNITIAPGNSFTLGPVTQLTHPSDVTGTSGWTYANPYRLSSENKTYLFSRGRNFNPVVRVRDDSTNTWGAATNFILNSGQRPYVKYHSNNTNRVGFAFTDGHPRNVQNNIYYGYLQDSAYWFANGTKIKDVSAGPLTMSDMQSGVDAPGMVFDRLANPAVTGDDSWIWDVAADSAGNPVVAFSTFPSTSNHQYHWAKWDPATQSWIDRILVKDAGPFISVAGEENYSAGLALDPTNPDIVYASWMNARTYNLLQYKANDSLGKTWATELIANGLGPTVENMRPYVPLNHPAGMDMVLYMRGQYDWWNFDRGVGYDTGIELWVNQPPLTPAGNSVLPEPSSAILLLLAPLVLERRRNV